MSVLKRSVSFASPEPAPQPASIMNSIEPEVEVEQVPGAPGEQYVGEDGQTYIVGEDGNHYIVGEDGLYYWADENGQTYVIAEDGQQYLVGEDGLRYWADENGQQFVIGGDGIQYSVGEDGEHYWEGPDGQHYHVGGDYQYYAYAEDGLAYAVGANNEFYPSDVEQELHQGVEEVSNTVVSVDTAPILTNNNPTSPAILRTSSAKFTPESPKAVASPNAEIVTFADKRAWKVPTQDDAAIAAADSDSDDGDDEHVESKVNGVESNIDNHSSSSQLSSVAANSSPNSLQPTQKHSPRMPSPLMASNKIETTRIPSDLKLPIAAHTPAEPAVAAATPENQSSKLPSSPQATVLPKAASFRADSSPLINANSPPSVVVESSTGGNQRADVESANAKLSQLCEDLESKLKREADQNNVLQQKIKALEENMRAATAQQQQQMQQFVQAQEQASKAKQPVVAAANANTGVDDDSEDEEQTLAKMVESMIRSGMVAVLWCFRTQIVKKYAVAFNKWKLFSQTEAFRKIAPSLVKSNDVVNKSASSPQTQAISVVPNRFEIKNDAKPEKSRPSLAERYQHLVQDNSSDDENEEINVDVNDLSIASDVASRPQQFGLSAPVVSVSVPGISPGPRLFGDEYNGLSDVELEARRKMIMGYAHQILNGVRIVDGIYPGPHSPPTNRLSAAMQTATPQQPRSTQRNRSNFSYSDQRGRSQRGLRNSRAGTSADMSSPDHKYPIHAQQQMDQFQRQLHQHEHFPEGSPEHLYSLNNSFANLGTAREPFPNSNARSDSPKRSESPRYQESTSASRALEYNYLPPTDPSAPLTSFAMKMYSSQVSPGNKQSVSNPRFQAENSGQRFFPDPNGNDAMFFPPNAELYASELSSSALYKDRESMTASKKKRPSYMEPTSTSFQRDRKRELHNRNVASRKLDMSYSQARGNPMESRLNSNDYYVTADGEMRGARQSYEAPSKRPHTANPRQEIVAGNSFHEKRRHGQLVAPNTTHNRLVNNGSRNYRHVDGLPRFDEYNQSGSGFYNDKDDGVLSDITYHVDHSYQRMK